MQATDFAVETWAETYPIAGRFNISRGSKTQAEVVVCRIGEAGQSGVGECVPYARYGETVESVLAQIDNAAAEAGKVLSFERIAELLPAGAARNAMDCALWDLRAKMSGEPAYRRVSGHPPQPLETAYTISLDTPEAMAAAARAAAHRPLLKVKLGGGEDIAAMHAVADAAPKSRIIVDANEAWHPENLADLMHEAGRARVDLIEQPLPKGEDGFLGEIPHPVPVCADESVHTAADLEGLRGRYDAVNIKLDKAGGLTEAIRMRDRARELGFLTMVGCMVGTSLSMAPAILLAQGADFVDLDGPLLLARDRDPGLVYEGSLVYPPSPDLWG